MISGALDAFYDIFAEDYYNYALAEAGVIQQMELGLPGLKSMVSYPDWHLQFKEQKKA